MGSYYRNNVKTATDIYRQIENWPTAKELINLTLREQTQLHKKAVGAKTADQVWVY